MDVTGSRVFAMAVNLPRSYMGKAGLRIDPDSVTLVARPIRHYRATVFSFIGAAAILMVPVLAMPGPLEVRAAVYGVIVGVSSAGVFGLLRASGGDSHSMSLPRASVSLAKCNGRVLVVSGAFDSRVRSGRWTLVADTRDDAEAIASALAAGGG